MPTLNHVLAKANVSLSDVTAALIAENAVMAQAGQSAAPFVDPQYPGGRQIFSQFLAEPRTYGITLRGKF
jgi:hypothetical protein